jgi:hypothetical protein
MPKAYQRALLALGALIVAGLIIKGLLPDQPPSSAPPVATTAVPIDLTALGLTNLGPLAGGPAPTARPGANWAEVARLTGSSTEPDLVRSDPFELSGGTVRLRYTIEGGDVTMLAVFVIADTGPTSAGGIPDILSVSQTSGERLISRGPGRYYVNVQTVGGDWTVEIDEERA